MQRIFQPLYRAHLAIRMSCALRRQGDFCAYFSLQSQFCCSLPDFVASSVDTIGHYTHCSHQNCTNLSG